MNKKPQILIGGASSGSGKTTFTLGLLRVLRNRGISVQPFKCGPDYIDPKYHSMAAENESVNLDSFLSSAQHIKKIYQKYGTSAGACVIEGVMGLFDGYNKMEGSSAQIAEILNVPVLLIINAKSCAYSVAPTIYGYKNFYKGINIAGVIFNMVGSEHHYQLLKQACEEVGIPALGYLPKCKEIEIPSRHLGLTLDERFRFDTFLQKNAELMEQHVEIERLLQIFQKEFYPDTNRAFRPQLDPEVTGLNPVGVTACDTAPAIASLPSLVIAVARDEAFNFIYRENIERLKELGDVVFFSPIKDHALPKADFVYLPGGYPELFIQEIAANLSMKTSIKEYVEQGGKMLAECGGMMYLCTCLTAMDGVEYPMCNVLPLRATMEGMKLHIGYRKFIYNGEEIRGHEFHYSKMEEEGESITQLFSAAGEKTSTQLYKYKNVLAGYTHLYWGEKLHSLLIL
ncbi:MAG: cobyrinate a,c-diamide synthase [Bacteroidales bacterium]